MRASGPPFNSPQIYYFFELAKLLTALIALATKGPDSEVVRLSVKAFRKHLRLLGGLLGFNSFHSGGVGGGVTVVKGGTTEVLGQRSVLIVVTALVAVIVAATIIVGGAAAKVI